MRALFALLVPLALGGDNTLTGYVMTNGNIRTAVAAWLSNTTAAEAAYGHISTWATGGVTDMSHLFCGYSSCTSSWCSDCNSAAASINEDISAWDTSGVTTMREMFYRASAFNQDISAWDTSGVKTIDDMFDSASAFEQNLGWCLGDKVDLRGAFRRTKCEPTSCGILAAAALKCGGGPMSNVGIRLAVAAWLSNATAAGAAYGHISTWETGGVTDMDWLFKGASSFNEDISAWDTSGVRTMNGMFQGASAFNQDIGAWNTSGVTEFESMFMFASAFNQDLGGWAVESDHVKWMNFMFYKASAFDQDLGWCLDRGVRTLRMFEGAACALRDPFRKCNVRVRVLGAFGGCALV